MLPLESPSVASNSENPHSTAFISGPIQPWDGYFSEFYEPKLKAAINANHSFVLGPAQGIDTISLKFLIDQGVSPTGITVYLANFENYTIRPHLEWFEKLRGNIKVEGVTTGDRDAAMTRDSEYDILRYMTIEEQQNYYGEMYYPRVSATERNERRRLGLPLHTNHALQAKIPASEDLHIQKRNGLRSRIQRIYQRVLG